MMAHYVGNLRTIDLQLQSHVINTDNQPVIEFAAPITQRRQRRGQSDWIVGDRLIKLMLNIQAPLCFETDPFLSALSGQQFYSAKAGMYLHRAQILKHSGHLKEANNLYAMYKKILERSKNDPGNPDRK